MGHALSAVRVKYPGKRKGVYSVVSLININIHVLTCPFGLYDTSTALLSMYSGSDIVSVVWMILTRWTLVLKSDYNVILASPQYSHFNN